jgi:hypothetical protein
MSLHEADGHGSARQPQGDFGRGKDHAPLGSSDDWNRQQENVGAYRDAEPADPSAEEEARAEVRRTPRARGPSSKKPGAGRR